MNMTRKRNEADGKSRGYRLCLLLAGILLVSAVLLSGCGAPKTAETNGGAESSSASETAAVDDGDACVIAADDFSNLQLSDPTMSCSASTPSIMPSATTATTTTTRSSTPHRTPSSRRWSGPMRSSTVSSVCAR